MATWFRHRDGSGWNIGFYPAHDDDWQLSMCHVVGYSTFIDVRFGKKHDWRFAYHVKRNDPPWRPLLHVPQYTFWRFDAHNHARGDQ